MRWKVAILTVSNGGFRGEQEETSAQVIRELVEEELGGEIVDERLVAGETNEIVASLIEMCEYFKADLILTSGGVGLSPWDVAPEATIKAADRLVPGMAEAMRAFQMQRSRQAMLNRGVCGIRKQTLIVNLPGDPKGVHDGMMAIIEQLPHALAGLSGREAEQEGLW